MSLQSSKSGLETAILAAFNHALQTAKNAGQNDVSGQIRSDLAKDLTNAIHDYVTSADVNISAIDGKIIGVTIDSKVIPGVAIAGTATPAGIVTGATTSLGDIIHKGKGKLE